MSREFAPPTMDKILRKFSLSGGQFNAQIGWAAAILWFIVVACTISSILSQPFNKKQRIFWIALVIAVPFVGVLAYIPFSFRTEDMPHIFLPKSNKKSRRRAKGPSGSN